MAQLSIFGRRIARSPTLFVPEPTGEGHEPGNTTMTHVTELTDKDRWNTPAWLIDLITEHVPLALDPCAGSNTSHAMINYELECGQDGLEEPWFGNVWVNPPFSDKQSWLDRAVSQVEQNNVARVFVLTPDSTDVQSWWHNSIVPNADYVWFSEGRIAYINPETGKQADSPPHGTAISMFTADGYEIPTALLDDFAQHGWVVTGADY